MQITNFDVSDDERKEAILEALSDDYSRKIINYTIDQSRSVIDIVKEVIF